MATKEDIKQALYDECKSVVSNTLSVTTPDHHVNLLGQRGQDAAYPFVGFEIFGRPLNRGLDGNVHVAQTSYSNGSIDWVQYRRDTRLTVAIGVLDDDGDVHQKDQLYTAIRDHFDEFLARNDPTLLHSDVERIRDGGFSDASTPESGVHGDRQQYIVDYSRYFKIDDYVPMNKITLSIEDLDQNVVYHADDVTA